LREREREREREKKCHWLHAINNLETNCTTFLYCTHFSVLKYIENYKKGITIKVEDFMLHSCYCEDITKQEVKLTGSYNRGSLSCCSLFIKN
jgi:hypothetical protein